LTIAFLTISVSRRAGGLFTSVRRLAQTLASQSDTDLRVLSVRDAFTADDLKDWLPLEPDICVPRWPAALRYAPGLGPRLAGLQPDLLRLDGLWTYPSLVAQRWRRSARRPLIVAPRGMLDPWALRNSRWKKVLAAAWFERENLESAACLHALCEPEARAFRDYGLRTPVCVVPNGVDLPERVPDPARQIPQLAGRKVLFFLSRLHPKKGLPNLLEAWAALHRELGAGLAGWCLAIGGWDQGGHEAQLQQQTTALGLRWSAFAPASPAATASETDASVFFLGPLFGEAKAAAFHQSAAFILPSFSEGLPMAVLEAWAWAKPVVMTPQCNLSEGFAAGAALRVEAKVADLRRGLCELVAMSDQDRAHMGARGRSLVAARFTWPQVARQMREVHDWVLGGGPPPACVVSGPA
jgi:glycosyltransferase involved in cell wall biosynthesis